VPAWRQVGPSFGKGDATPSLLCSSSHGPLAVHCVVKTLPIGLQGLWILVLLFAQPVIAAPGVVFQTAVALQPDEDLAAACRYEITLMDPSKTVKGIWVIFERSRDMLLYYQDADVRAFARRHDLALLFPFHCRSKSETDMNVDPSKGIGRALFSALIQLSQTSSHPELPLKHLQSSGSRS
jgi:hypothetical protein